jgi:ribonuclease HI
VPWSTLYIIDPEVLWRRQQPVAVRDFDFMWKWVRSGKAQNEQHDVLVLRISAFDPNRT